MNKTAGFLSCLLSIFALASCSLPVGLGDSSPSQEIINQYQTVSVMLTQTALVTPLPDQLATSMPVLRTVGFTPSVPPPTLTYSPQAITPQFTLTREGQINAPCDLARAGRPIDVTIPDETRMRPGEFFSKTWRLVNVGSCNWSREYAVVWFSGDDLGVVRAQNFNGVVLPGQSVDVTVDMQAPRTAGTYQSNWKLRNQQGQLFGIGPNGSAPFWVRIVVVPQVTATPTPVPPTATATELPVVFSSGMVDLSPEVGVDLDSGQVDQALQNDLHFQVDAEGQAQLQPQNGARFVWFGPIAPTLQDCLSSSPNPAPLLVEQVQPGTYLCFRTTEGLPGSMLFSALDLKNEQITLEFTTWSIP